MTVNKAPEEVKRATYPPQMMTVKSLDENDALARALCINSIWRLRGCILMFEDPFLVI